MVPTASPWVPQALPELTVIKNVRTSRNTIIRVRIACAPRTWRIPCLVILGQTLDYRSLQTGGRAPESSRRTQHPPRELQRAPSAPKRRPGHSPGGVVLPWRPLLSLVPGSKLPGYIEIYTYTSPPLGAVHECVWFVAPPAQNIRLDAGGF